MILYSGSFIYRKLHWIFYLEVWLFDFYFRLGLTEWHTWERAMGRAKKDKP